jgi:hypothetical protein
MYPFKNLIRKRVQLLSQGGFNKKEIKQNTYDYFLNLLFIHGDNSKPPKGFMKMEFEQDKINKIKKSNIHWLDKVYQIYRVKYG